MIRIPRLYILLIVAIYLSGCKPGVTTTPTNAESPSPVLVSPTLTITPSETGTPTLSATLTPLQANEKLKLTYKNQ